MIRLKPGVSLKDVCPQIVFALQVADGLWSLSAALNSFGDAHLWVTSCNDSEHSGKPVGDDPRDPHFMGKAVDLRIKNVPAGLRAALVLTLREFLGPEFYVRYEYIGEVREHVHVQYGHVKPASK